MKKTIAQIRMECKEQGLVYDRVTKVCRPPLRGAKVILSPKIKVAVKDAAEQMVHGSPKKLHKVNGHGFNYDDPQTRTYIAHEIVTHTPYATPQFLANGRWGAIFLVEKDNTKYVMKVECRKSGSKYISFLNREIKILYRLNKKISSRKYIPKYIDDLTFVSTSLPKVSLVKFRCLVMPIYGKRLESRRFVSEKDARILLKNMFKCLQVLHSNGYLHNDINMTNFISATPDKNEGSSPIILIDFGLTTQSFYTEGRKEKKMGTYEYISLSHDEGYGVTYRDDAEAVVYLAWDMMEELPWKKVSERKRIEMKRTLKDAPKWVIDAIQVIRKTPFNVHVDFTKL